MASKRTETEMADPVVEDTDNIAKLVDEVVEGHAPILVARDGEPKAALVSLDDYARLKRYARSAKEHGMPSWDAWFAQTQEFQEQMLARRGNKPIDKDSVDRAWREARADLDERDSHNAGLGR